MLGNMTGEAQTREIALTEEELLSLLRNFENAYIERKTIGDSKDWLKTVVAFANSTPIGYPAVLFIGVKDDGTPEQTDANLASLQQTLSQKLKRAYPPIYCLPRIIRCEGRQVLAVIVPGSPDRPHFLGPAYVREGSKTVDASKTQFDLLIAERNSVAYRIRELRGNTVSFYMTEVSGAKRFTGSALTVVDCNQFFVTLKTPDPPYELLSFALRGVDISYDHRHKRPAIGVSYK